MNKRKYNILYKKASGGDVEAMFELGEAYKQGEIVEKNYTSAFNWFRQAAKLNHTKAQVQLAVCYESGYGTAESIKNAIKWYRKAAQNGDDGAMFVLALLLEEFGAGSYSAETAKLMACAASLGNLEAKKWYRKNYKQPKAKSGGTPVRKKATESKPVPTSSPVVTLYVKSECNKFELADTEYLEINDNHSPSVKKIYFKEFPKINAKERQALIKLAYCNTVYASGEKVQKLVETCMNLDGGVCSRLNNMFRKIFPALAEQKTSVIDKSKGQLRLELKLANPELIKTPS